MTDGLETLLAKNVQPFHGIALWSIRLAMAGIFLFHGPTKFMMPGMAEMMGLPVSAWYLAGLPKL